MKYVFTSVLLSVLYFWLSLWYYFPADFDKKIDLVVGEIEQSIVTQWSWLRSKYVEYLDWYAMQNKDNKTISSVVDYIVKRIDVPKPFNYLHITPYQTQWPYYPTTKPIDIDNNLLYVSNWERAQWDKLTIRWRVGYLDGTLLRSGTVEIRQTDDNAIYFHPWDSWFDKRDISFQFYGESTISPDGFYSFVTIIPWEYDFRPSHIHVIVRDEEKNILQTTQMYFSWDVGLVNSLEWLDWWIEDSFHMLIMNVEYANGSYFWFHDIVLE